MKVTYPLCKAIGHHWDPYDVDEFVSLVKVRLKCTECGSLRWFMMSRDGYLASASRYNRPEDYRQVGMAGRQKEVKAAARVVLADALGVKRQRRTARKRRGAA